MSRFAEKGESFWVASAGDGAARARRSTAKITSQHGMIYQTLEKTLGHDGARIYRASPE